MRELLTLLLPAPLRLGPDPPPPPVESLLRSFIIIMLHPRIIVSPPSRLLSFLQECLILFDIHFLFSFPLLSLFFSCFTLLLLAFVRVGPSVPSSSHHFVHRFQCITSGWSTTSYSQDLTFLLLLPSPFTTSYDRGLALLLLPLPPPPLFSYFPFFLLLPLLSSRVL